MHILAECWKEIKFSDIDRQQISFSMKLLEALSASLRVSESRLSKLVVKHLRRSAAHYSDKKPGLLDPALLPKWLL
jgi:hypothetical protein